MDLCTYICVKKLIFALTIIKLDENSMIKKLFKIRAKAFNDNIAAGLQNEHKSPIFEILRVSYNYGLYEEIMRVLFGTITYNKNQWKTRVWATAWGIEDQFWKQTASLFRGTDLLFKTTSNPRYLTWWHISDLIPRLMRICEDMARMVCGTSNLKGDSIKHKRETYINRVCLLCNLGMEENTVHIVMQCPFHERTRHCMYEAIDNLEMKISTIFQNLQGDEKFLALMGKNIDGIDPEGMFKIWTISGTYISMIYRTTMAKHADHT